MPNCKICGDPVHVATVYHDDCLREEFEKLAEVICDDICGRRGCGLCIGDTCELTVFIKEVFGA